MFDLSTMMEQAKAFQEKMQEDLEKLAVASTSGGGAVKVIVNGKKEVTNIEIGEEALRDADMLSDMILAALNGAYQDVDRQVQGKMPNLGDIDLSAISRMFEK